MYEQPPALAERLLVLALGRGDEARAILGDLAEDYAVALRDRGPGAARRWYWREAIMLGGSSTLGRLLGRAPLSRSSHRRDSTVNNPLSSIGVFQDAQYAFRAIRRDRGFFVFATLVIGLGVGASTAVFSVVSPLLLQPLPFHEPERLVLIENSASGGTGMSAITSRTSNVRDYPEIDFRSSPNSGRSRERG